MALLGQRDTATSPGVAPSQVWDAAEQVFSNLHCGEDISVGAACYISTADGLVYLSGGSGVTALTQAGAAVHGYAVEEALFAQASAVNLVESIDWGLWDKASTGATYVAPGKSVYLHFATTAKGQLDDAPTFPGQVPLGFSGTGGRARLYANIGGGGGGYVATKVTSEIPTGTVDGTRTVFTLAHTPNSGGIKVYVGASNTALSRIAPAAFTQSGTSLTFGVAPSSGNKILVDYDYNG